MREKIFSGLIMLVLLMPVFFCDTIEAKTVAITTPEAHFGFVPGTDRMLFNYDALIAYLMKLDKQSSMLKLVKIGKSPMGKPLYIAFISSGQNIENLDKLKEINRLLALNPNLDERTRESMFKNGKVFFLATLSMHSGEVGPSQSAPLIAHKLLTSDDPKLLKWLDDVVYMMVPCHNPDGMDMVVKHYKKYKGTKYEGSRMPGIYHKYVGHDNNRDFVILSQADTKAISWIWNREWFPQVMVEKHQMGSTSARYFVPPPHDAIAQVIDARLWQWMRLFGSNMAKDLVAKGLKGVSQQYIFDDYWPGSTQTCIWKNVIGFLTEAASAKYAKPIFIEPTELRAGGKGLAEYKKGINFTLPWPGGWWRLSDIIEYEISSTMSILKTSSFHRDDILRFRNDICRSEVKKGRTEPPFYYILPKKQPDQSELVNLVNLLIEHGIEVYELKAPVSLGNKMYNEGDIAIPLAQPFRPFLIEVMEKQKYPVRHYTPGGKMIRPYDITSWSLPLHRGLEVDSIKTISRELETLLGKLKEGYKLKRTAPEKYAGMIFSAGNNESYRASFMAGKLGLNVSRVMKRTNISGTDVDAGSFYIRNDISKQSQISVLLDELNLSPHFIQTDIDLDLRTMKTPRIALVETWYHDMDAGWTRFLFDSYHIPYSTLRPGDIPKTDFSKFDVVIFPSVQKSILMKGKRKYGDSYYSSGYPPGYSDGMGAKGLGKIVKFIDNGGLVISWGQSAELFIGELSIEHSKGKKEEFRLPVRNIGDGLAKSGLFCPGSYVNVKLLKEHPLTLGMPDEVGAFYRGKPVFQTSIPSFDMDRRVIGTFPEEDILLSGHCDKEELLENKAVIVWLKKNKGELVLIGFNPQFRTSTPVTYKLLFNSILLR